MLTYLTGVARRLISIYAALWRCAALSPARAKLLPAYPGRGLTWLGALGPHGGDAGVEHVVDGRVAVEAALHIMLAVGLVTLLVAAVLQAVPLQVLERGAAGGDMAVSWPPHWAPTPETQRPAVGCLCALCQPTGQDTRASRKLWVKRGLRTKWKTHTHPMSCFYN